MDKISIAGLDKATVLAALYNASRPLGMGLLNYTPAVMTPEEAAKYLKTTNTFDYLKGRVMKIRFNSTMLDVGLYDRDNGQGAAKAAIDALRTSGK